MGGSGGPSSSGFSLPDGPPPPVPVGVVYTAGTRRVDITFDSDLDTGSLPDLSTLFWASGGTRYAATSRSFPASNVLRFVHNFIGSAQPDPDGARYTATPALLLGANGAEVAPFIGLT